ncbi:chaperone protein dnaJ 20, chloroplastic-like [Lolium rigidum]|uniref:chaperone protein dnaJ 20, chloroplastic-like n=1 Tax=Lolium rigidum TaxID=89674 RepID=UPI001F5C698A|nr:chaperone protein dnaJ 20, chloroplastic-like [Lolium rigidum]
MPHLTTSSAAAFGVAGGGGHPVFRPLPRRTQLRARAAWAAGGGVRTAELPQPTFYELLGISAEGSSFEDVRAAYRRMARKYHPDVSPPDAAKEHTRRFIQVQEAYETLSDPSRRSSYDQALARGVCRLAFDPASRRHASNSAFYHQEMEEKSGWRTSWEGQIAELKKRSTGKDSEENLSWGARMRRRRADQM